MFKQLVGAGVVLLLVGAGCTGGSDDRSWGISPLAYALPTDGNITVATNPVRADSPSESLVKADTLLAQATECGNARSADYYLDIEKLYVGVPAQEYTFAISGDYEMPAWTVTLMPNLLGYTSLDSFKRDFDICAAGGAMYPADVSTSTLMFVDSCGTGYSGGKENGCDAIRKAVESTLSIE